MGLLTFFHVPSLSTQLLILAICIIITGGFYAHPAIKRKLSPVISEQNLSQEVGDDREGEKYGTEWK